MNIAITIATGSPQWGQMALNWALSVKVNNPGQKTALVYTESALGDIKELLIDSYWFDYTYCIDAEVLGLNASGAAFKIKTELYRIATSFSNYNTDAFVFMDADTVILPGQDIEDYFIEFSKGKKPPFALYTNDVFNYKTNTRNREDYTFWCNPLEAKEHFKLNTILPQFNSSFIYFKKSSEAALLFEKASKIWHNTSFQHQEYKGVKPDELCFNIAAALLHSSFGVHKFKPFQVPYRPIYFQCFSEPHDLQYLHHNYRAFGFAGTEDNPYYLIKYYNQVTKYYRDIAGIVPVFQLENHLRVSQDPNQIRITTLSKKTIARAGDLPNSDGGAFNPSATFYGDRSGGEMMRIIRKEKGIESNAYIGTTAIPHLQSWIVQGNESSGFLSDELKMMNFPEHKRVEDFRLFMSEGYDMASPTIFCSHSIVTESTTSNLQAQTCISIIEHGELVFHSIPALPIKTKKAEKNWVFFCENDKMYCLYSISPYLLFSSSAEDNYTTWTPVDVQQTTIDFFHPRFLCNSINPIRINDEYYLAMFHTKESGIYFHGAALINAKTKQIDYHTYNSILIKDPAKATGFQRGLVYVSGALLMGNTLQIYFGEGDSHACRHDYGVQEFISCIKSNSKTVDPIEQFIN